MLKRILVGSPICQKPDILKAFLESLSNLEHKEFLMDYIFVDDNQDMDSSEILNQFSQKGSVVSVLSAAPPGDYLCDEGTHYWSNALMFRVAKWKNRIIKYALDQEYDGLFLVDSDLILNPELLEHLEKAEKDVISEIFWTRWHPGECMAFR